MVRKTISWQFYYLAIFFLGTPMFAELSKNANQIYFRDYKTYRIYYHNHASLLVNKKSTKKILIHKKNNSILTTKSDFNKKTIEYMVPAKEKRHTVVYKFEKNKNPQVGYFANNRKVYFAESEPEVKSIANKQISAVCEKPKNRNIDDIKNISKFITDNNSINSIDIESGILDPKTCTAENLNVDLLKKNLGNLFNSNGLNLIKCLQSDLAQKKMEKDEALLTQANIFVTRMVGFLDDMNVAKINKNLTSNKFKNNFQIKCESTPKMEGKIACFDDNYENPSMSIDLEKIPKNSNGTIDTDKLNAFILHEFMHAGTQQPETSGPDPKCLDEAIVKSLEALCGDQREKVKCPAPSIIKTEKGSVVAAAATVVAANEIARSMPVKTENQIPTTTEVSQLANATLSQMTTPSVARNYQEGDKVQVTDPATISQVSNTFTNLNVLSNNAGTVMKAGAAAAVGSIAVASTSTAARSISSVASDQKNTYVPYPPSEIIADKYSTGTDDGTISRLANSTLKTNSSVLSEEISSAKANVTTIAASKNEVLPTRATAKNNSESTAHTDAAQINRKIASVSSSVENTQPATTVELPTRTQLVENLKIRKTMSGNDYNEIKKYYADPNFKSQLSTLGISIELKTANMNQKIRAIGADMNSKIKFIDDGQNLIRQK